MPDPVPAITVEARELAFVFAKTLRAVKPGDDDRRAVANQVLNAATNLRAELESALRRVIDVDSQKDPNAVAKWKVFESDLAILFSRDPNLAERIWPFDATGDSQSWPRPFWLVYREELKQISHRPKRQSAQAGDAEQPANEEAPITYFASEVDQSGDIYRFAANQQLAGLAFSGGGIRSATFNLGVLQALAELKILPQVDYISTVSGGGYIGSWFASWLWRKQQSVDDFEPLLSPEQSPDPNATGQSPIRFLRQFSNYLTPEVGVFSTDTWTMAAIYMRNILLNQVTLLSGFGALLVVPRLLGWLSFRQNISNFALGKSPFLTADWLLAIAAALLFVISVVFIATDLGLAVSRSIGSEERTPGPGGAGIPAKGQPPAVIFRRCVAPLLVGILLASQLFWKHAADSIFDDLTSGWFFWPSLAFFGLLSALISWHGGFVACFKKRLSQSFWNSVPVVFSLVTAGTALAGTLLLRIVILVLRAFHGGAQAGTWHTVVWGPPLLLLAVSLSAVIQIGLMGADFPDAGREWLSRFRATLNIYTFFWLAITGAALYAPLLITMLVMRLKLLAAGLGTAWISTTIGSLLAGKSARSGKVKDGAPTTSWLDVLAKVGPPVFLAGYVIFVSCCVHLVLTHSVTGSDYAPGNLARCYWDVLNFPARFRDLWTNSDAFITAPGSLFGVLAIVCALFAWRVDINEFSLHHFYKNRLVRCYLGASNEERKPNPFIGFDERDEINMIDLRLDRAARANASVYTGPYHIVNTTLNLASGGQLAWQERKAASFIFTPCYSGFHLERESDHPGDEGSSGLRFCAYRKTEQYAYKNGIGLGTAMAISGAAADPNQGYNTSPAVAFLMTVFDVRLGWWLGNPRKDGPSKESSPHFGLAAMFSDLFGFSDDRSNFVSLSDGGHFDNMGIYELLRRRCKYIILCDAEQDGSFTFGGLGMAIRKCRIDFGAEIDIDPRRIIPSTATGRSDVHGAVGTIKYADGATGVIVYIKSSITGDEPEDVLQYAASKRTFPHETTADQWFTESQFESYRKLGYHAAKAIITPSGHWGKWAAGQRLGLLIDRLVKEWYPVNPALEDHATTHTRTLNELMDKVRLDPGLHALGAQLFPGATFHPGPANPQAEYFFSLTIIQLVEDIYFDFNLDREQWRKDPRIGGWMSIFRAWYKVDAIQKTWEANSGTFRQDFQNFWNELKLEGQKSGAPSTLHL